MESRSVWSFAVLALMGVLAIASPGNHLLGSAAGVAVVGRISRPASYNQRFSDHDYFSAADDWKRDHPIGIIGGVSSNLSPQRSRSRDDQTGTNRHRLQQTSTSAEVQVLMAFKEGITSDSLGALSSWNPNDADACHWKGITCNQRSRSIVAFELGSFRLTGTISPLLGRLSNLQTVDLSDNSFNGEIPTTLLNCSQLSYLGLRHNNLTGQMPSQAGDLLHLQFLDLGYNLLLTGPIPASLTNCSLLEFIFFDFTGLRGEIPSTLGQLARLEVLNLTNTLNSGVIPKSLGNCSYLTSLTMGNAYDIAIAESRNLNTPEDEIGGEIPAELAKLTQLKRLQISGSSIQGAIPAWISNLTALTALQLSWSSFSGEIPAFLGTLPLRFLDLAGSNYSGAIPVAISNCTDLSNLGIYSNLKVSGAIPPELGLLSKLATLILVDSSFTGTIPSSLSNCSAFRVLEIGNNLFDPQPVPSWVKSFVNLTNLELAEANLYGDIPIALGEASKLNNLYLTQNQLTGPIPAGLGNCTSLRNLELSVNQLSGEVPPEIWTLSQLQFFAIDDNALTGRLPASIGNLSSLGIFGCSGNAFSGGIPSQLGSLQSLQVADVTTNVFDGSIPQSLGNCSALYYLDVSVNELSGSIPGSLGNLTTLEQLFLSENRLEGRIPGDLMRCTALGDLDLSRNLLVGGIPQEIGQLVSLQGLYLYDNKLSGDLPNSLGLCRGLSDLDVSYNAFYGRVPGDAIANMSSTLSSLNVSHNRLSGSLPPELGKLTVIYNLDMSANNFSGSIPSDLGDCKSLLRLDLSINNLSGGIPAVLGQLQYLAFVNVSYNHLEGPLPDGGIFNSTNVTATSFVGNPGLCGSILKGCPLDPSPVSESSCKSSRCGSKRTALIVACAGTGVVLLLVAAAVLICWRFYSHGKKDVAQFAVVTFATGLEFTEEGLLSIIDRPENIVGTGASSTVYKGVLNGGRTVAIKVLRLLIDSDDHEYNQQAARQLHIEADTLAEMRHRNILKVFGLFSTKTIKALILEFMPNASLHKQLYDVEVCELSWEARLNIALGVANGIVYLHSQAHVPVIHRDLKPSNIFLDADLEPKLGDFGISRFVNPNRSGDGEITASKFCGTFGYIPPEYAATTRVSTKGDVYSYGVILLELLTRKTPIVAVANSEESDLGLIGQQSRHLVDYVLESSKEMPLAVLDPMLLVSEGISASNGDDNNSGEQMKLLLRVGLLCTQNDPRSRPDMTDVLAMLLQIKERGWDPAHRPTVPELADEITIWPSPMHVDQI